MRQYLKYFLVLSILLSLMLSSCSPPEEFIQTDYYSLRMGDSMHWAHSEFPPEKAIDNEDITGKGIFWVRINADFPDVAKPYTDIGITVAAMGAYEAYWDGVYIGKSGQLKTATLPEIPSKYMVSYPLPDTLVSVGRHTLALRMSKDDPVSRFHAYFFADKYVDLLQKPLRVSQYMFILAGAFLIISIYFLFIFFNQSREIPILIFSIICMIFLGLILMEYLKLFYQYEYPFQFKRLDIIAYLHLSLTILFPLFFVLQFSFPWKRYLFVILGVVILYLEWNYHGDYDKNALRLNILMWAFSTGIVAYAAYAKKRGALVVLSALIGAVLIIYFMPRIYIPFVSYFDVALFFSFILIVLSMLYLMTIKRKEEQKAYEASLILSERLKNELLKKNIKPHFIMNTLTSLIDWVEESPKDGVKFISALADEFEVLNQIADYKQIPIGQEIKLCKSHIKVMGYRKEINYIWEDEGIDSNEIIPPAVIHTIVENGVTHSLPDENDAITFRLIYKKKNGFKEYTLRTIATNRAKKKFKLVEGTGMKYIKARLQESYQNDWKIESEAVDAGWETRIVIRESD